MIDCSNDCSEHADRVALFCGALISRDPFPWQANLYLRSFEATQDIDTGDHAEALRVAAFNGHAACAEVFVGLDELVDGL